MTTTAWVGDTAVAKATDVVMVEGNAYFPLDAVEAGVLTATRRKTLCFWKGVASYYSVTVDGQQIPHAAWEYRHPSPLARRIKGRVAFSSPVDVREDTRQ